jgi:hypothetical protein
MYNIFTVLTLIVKTRGEKSKMPLEPQRAWNATHNIVKLLHTRLWQNETINSMDTPVVNSGHFTFFSSSFHNYSGIPSDRASPVPSTSNRWTEEVRRVKMLHRCEIVTHTPQEYTMQRHISCISISATMRDITHVIYMYHNNFTPM